MAFCFTFLFGVLDLWGFSRVMIVSMDGRLYVWNVVLVLE